VKLRAFTGWFLTYSVITLLLTYPLVRHLSAVVPHDLGDPLLNVCLLWWNAHVLPLTERWWNGFAFYPATGFAAYSDHRLGESLIATPLQWLGCSPVTAFNLTLLALSPLCAICAHWLAFTLTGRHEAAAICGLAYAFSPYRMGHLEHLELLAGFGMPAALGSLHRYMETRRPAWLVAFSSFLVMQGLSTAYYLLFFSVLLALWMAWFVRPREIRPLAAIGAACGAAALVLLPIAIGYFHVHRRFGFARPAQEVIALSGDLLSLGTAASTSLLWSGLARPYAPELHLFPGLTIAAIAIAGAVAAWRKARAGRDRFDRISRWALLVAGLLAALAICGWAFSPWRFDLPGARVSSAAPFKPMSLALLAAGVAVALSRPVRLAYAQRSPLGFYVVATMAMFLCSLGPRPSLMNHQVLYEPPYAWLMRVPIFGSIRAPARFAMLMILCLSVTGALAFSRLRVEGLGRRVLATALMAGILADGWIRSLALPALPGVWPSERAAGYAAVVELPLGDLYDDVAAMYRATHHRRPVVNGYAGFEPTHYFTLKTALDEHDPAALDAVAAAGPLLVVVDKRRDADRGWQRYVSSLARVAPLGDDENHAFYAIGPGEAPAACRGARLPLAAVADTSGSLDLRTLTDGNVYTRWITPHAQREGDLLTVDIGRAGRVCAVTLSVGEFRKNYPRLLLMETSLDAIHWAAPVSIRTAALTVRAALTDPKAVAIDIPVGPVDARFVRLRIGEAADDAWVVGEISVTGVRPPE
jgi:hypothetical protein